MERYLIATTKSWNIEKVKKLEEKSKDKIFLISNKDELNLEYLNKIRPKYIFFPHWSWIIPKDVYENYECIVFHMTDLPFGRGGSPLQNLLVRGIYNTKVSALRVCKGIDEGDIYLKKPIDISEGSAEEIFTRISSVIFDEMIPEIVSKEIKPVPQEGEVVTFSRRKPEQSIIPDGLNQRQLYDYIRMLDGEGYPKAFTMVGNGRMEYSNARIINDKLFADVEYIED